MQILTRLDKGVIKDYYHMRTMDECQLNETITSIVNLFTKPLGSLLYMYFDFKKIK